MSALYLTTGLGWPFVLALFAAIAAGMIVAVPLGWLTCRLDRFSYAVLGFAFTYLVSMLMSSGLFVRISGGEMGKPVPAGALFGVGLEGIPGYVFVAATTLAAFAVASLIFRSTMGRMLLVMRQDDVVARSVGVNTDIFKIGLSAIVGGYGSLGGVLASQATNYVAPPHFECCLIDSAAGDGTGWGRPLSGGRLCWNHGAWVGPAMLRFKQVDRELIGRDQYCCLSGTISRWHSRRP